MSAAAAFGTPVVASTSPAPTRAVTIADRILRMTSPVRLGARAVRTLPTPPRRRRSQHRQQPLQLERGDLPQMILELLLLVPQEEVEDMITEGLGDQFGPLHPPDRLVQVLRQRLDPQGPPLPFG